jgi:hypothetical protein
MKLLLFFLATPVLAQVAAPNDASQSIDHFQVATLVPKFMTVGAFYAPLLLGPSLMQQIIDSYVRFGSMASGVPSITAGDILADGIDIAARLLISAVLSGLSMSLVIPTITLTKSIVLFCCLAEPEKVAANIFAGQPQFTGHDVTNTYMPYVNTGITLASSAFNLGVGRAIAPLIGSVPAAPAVSTAITVAAKPNSQSAPPPRRP